MTAEQIAQLQELKKRIEKLEAEKKQPAKKKPSFMAPKKGK